MTLIQGSGWKAHFDEERNLYTARTSVPGAIKLFEINEEVFKSLQSDEMSDDDKYCLIHDKGRKLYMDIDDRCGPPYTIVLDDDYRTLCPWAELPESNTVWPEALTDAVVELFASEANNREQRREKRAKREQEKDKE
jgi:hypothetical protein